MFNRKTINRFFRRVNLPNDLVQSCWLWTGALVTKGYGAFSVGTSQIMAHQFSYRLFKGLIEPNHHIYHTCGVPNCVNPVHLEMRLFNSLRTECQNGHIQTDATRYKNGMCKICLRKLSAAYQRARYYRKRHSA